jgi:hypothetical protein
MEASGINPVGVCVKLRKVLITKKREITPTWRGIDKQKLSRLSDANEPHCN